MQHTQEEIIANNVLLVLDVARIRLDTLTKHYLFMDIKKSISINTEGKYQSDWKCHELANMPCNEQFSIKDKKVVFHEIIQKSINHILEKAPSLNCN